MDEEKIELKEILKTQRGASPVAELREKHDIALEDKKYDDHWQSCCMTIDRRATRYFTQLAIAVMIITFCIVQLIRIESCEGQALYSGLLMTVIGIMLPAPSLH